MRLFGQGGRGRLPSANSASLLDYLLFGLNRQFLAVHVGTCCWVKFLQDNGTDLAVVELGARVGSIYPVTGLVNEIINSIGSSDDEITLRGTKKELELWGVTSILAWWHLFFGWWGSPELWFHGENPFVYTSFIVHQREIIEMCFLTVHPCQISRDSLVRCVVAPGW
jgi:hypothetical protein